ncbi:MAG TPA: SDR family NAD(P)-dependent oxidoreductase, partial [Pyrinomonadaceae bacterium]
GNWRQQRLVEQLAAELKAGMTEEVVAYRGQHRWVQNFEAVRLEAGTGVPDRLRIGGVYLITGGTGGIGLEIARYLAETVGAKVVLVSRRGFVEGEEKRRRVEEIERAGGEVLILKGDVSDEGEMDEVIKRAKQRYGEIHGVIHAAGVTGGASARAIQETNPAEAQLQFQPKIFGLLALEKVLRGENLDFVLLLSSLSSVLGGLGFTSYAAANIFMDAFAHRQSQISPVPWLSINWDGWNLSGSKIRDTAIGAGLAELAITPQEGMEALRRILLLPAMTPQIVVSTGDLQIRIDRWIKQEALTQSESAEPGEPSVLHPRPELQNAYVAPRNEREETVTAMLQKLLGISQIGVYDDFFELGGHSLLATQVISRIRDVFHVNLSLRGLFETPNVAGMVESIELAMSAEPHLQAPPLKRVSRDEKLPLSFGQQRLWFLNKLQPDSIAYNLPGAVRLTGQLNIDALEQTLGEIIRRHEVLRTTFSTVNGQPVALIREATPLALPILDLSALPEADREVELRRLATEEAQRPFDLTQGPLLRVSLVRTHSSEHVALVTMHHIVSDGWSPAILVREMMALYEAYSTGQPSPLPELTIQYADFAHWQREWLQGEVLEAQLSYWRQQLDGAAQTLELPTDRPRPAVQSFNGAEESLEFSPELTERLGALSRQEGVTLFMTLLAAFQTLLSRYSRQKDIVVGSPIANRTRAELEGLIGFFVNTLVLRTSLRGEPSFRELLTRVREVALGAYAHQDVP